MTQTLAQICTEALEGVGVDSPGTFASGGDLGRQMVAIANGSIRDMTRRTDWQELRLEGTFTTLAAELQTVLSTDFPYYRKIIGDSMWNRTTQESVIGPLTPQAWQRIKSDDFTPSFPVYFLRADTIYFPGTPTAGETIYFEYIDKRAVADSGGTPKERFTADTDVPRLDDHALMLCVRWRFLQRKGLEYGEAFREYEDWIMLRQAENLPVSNLNMNPRSTRWRGSSGEGDWLQGLTWNP